MAVEFCTGCHQSLPSGDLSFKEGNAFTSYDYICPHCRNPANPDPDPHELPEPSDRDLVIRDGQATAEGA